MFRQGPDFHRDKRLFEISEVEIARVNCICICVVLLIWAVMDRLCILTDGAALCEMICICPALFTSTFVDRSCIHTVLLFVT